MKVSNWHPNLDYTHAYMCEMELRVRESAQKGICDIENRKSNRSVQDQAHPPTSNSVPETYPHGRSSATTTRIHDIELRQRHAKHPLHAPQYPAPIQLFLAFATTAGIDPQAFVLYELSKRNDDDVCSVDSSGQLDNDAMLSQRKADEATKQRSKEANNEQRTTTTTISDLYRLI